MSRFGSPCSSVNFRSLTIAAIALFFSTSLDLAAARAAATQPLAQAQERSDLTKDQTETQLKATLERLEQHGQKKPEYVETLEQWAEVQYRNDQLTSARDAYKRVLSLSEKIARSQPVTALIGLGHCYYRLGDYPDSIPYYRRALDTLNAQADVDPALLESCLEGLAGAYFHTKQLNQSEELYKRMVDLSEKIYGSKSLQLSWALLSLKDVYQRLGKSDDARRSGEQAAAILREANLQRLQEGMVTRASDSAKHPISLRRADERSLPLIGLVDPVRSISAIILCVHGLGLRNASFASFGKRIAAHGFMVLAIDVRGFGSWQEARGHEQLDLKSCLTDLDGILRLIRKSHPDKPIFLLGESMGGAIVLRTAALHPELIDGVIASVPAAKRFTERGEAIKVGINLIRSPNRAMGVTDVLDRATDDQKAREFWARDPLARFELSPKELIQFQVFMRENVSFAPKIQKLPVLIVQGLKDRLVKPSATIDLYNSLGTEDRDLLMLGTSEHLIFEAIQCTDTAFDTVLAWLNAHLPKLAKPSG